MMKRYSHHTFSVQSPHTMDAILFRDVKIRNCGYRPYVQALIICNLCAYHILVHVVVRWHSRTLEQENFASEISVKQVKSWVKCRFQNLYTYFGS